jgi:hypothetical protein
MDAPQEQGDGAGDIEQGQGDVRGSNSSNDVSRRIAGNAVGATPGGLPVRFRLLE